VTHGGHWRRIALAIGAAGLVVCLLADPVAAQGTESAKVRAKVKLLELEPMVAAGRCGEALPKIEKARRDHPDDAVLAQLEGQCRLRTFDYSAALSALQDAKRLDPQLQNVDIGLAIAFYHLEDFEAAGEAIEAARTRHTPDYSAQLHLYSGLILLGRGEARAAALDLERARVADAAQVEPVASFYAGLAWQSINQRDEARESFERVIEVDGDGTWGRQAREMLASEQLAERAWARLTAGLDYDSNVVLLGETLPVPQGITGESDGRVVWFAEGGAELFRTERWSGGVMLEYAGSVHFDLRDYDVQYPTLAGWIDRGVGERGLARLRYSIGHAWVGYGSFLLAQQAIGSYFHNWGEAGSTEFAATWDWNDYRFPLLPVAMAEPDQSCSAILVPCSPFGIDANTARNRDGNGLRLSLVHRYPVRSLRGDFLRGFVVRGGYTYGHYWAEGDDWDFQAHELVAAFETGLPWRLDLDVLGTFTYAPFENISSYPTPPVVEAGVTYTVLPVPRTDKIWNVATVLARPINDWLEVSARYYYTRNISNVPVFDYDRNVVGGYLTVGF
jgi:tetratricopeptide (TPR) repeat protein